MASIFGFYGDFAHTHDMTRRMFEALANRGGNAQAIHCKDRVALGIRGQAQDVKHSFAIDASQTLVAAVEGEVYNLDHINNLLGEERVICTQDNIGQAILLLYEKFGEDFPRYLNGIFGIALWNHKKKILYLVRDHLGAHSLFYAQKNHTILFASTLRPLITTGEVQRDLSLSAMNAYFASTAISSPRTMLKEISCVRPGSLVIYAHGACREYQYWPSQDLQEDATRTEEDFVEEVHDVLLDSIKIRADYGGKYGSLVSGGVDSSIIAATLAKHRHPEQLAAFSVAFKELVYSDAELQHIMYDRYNIAPNVASLGAEEFADILQQGVAYLDKPVNDDAFVGMYKAFELAKQTGYDVVFDGEAADELFFTGHTHGEKAFQKFLLLPFWLRKAFFATLIPSIPIGDSLWKKGWRFLYKLGLSNEERTLTRLPCFYKHSPSILRDPGAGSLGDPLSIGKKYLDDSALRDPLNRYHYGILKTFLPDDLLFKNERMASAHGITNRTPFIDYRLVELAFRIPEKYKLTKASHHDDGTKQIYKKAIKGLIPEEILRRKKTRGFSQPSSVWYRRELKDFLYNTLFSQDSLCLQYVNKQYMKQLFVEHVAGKVNCARLLNSVLIFELWLKSFLKESRPSNEL